MTDTLSEKKKNYWFKEHFGKFVVLSSLFIAFLGGYDTLRNKGNLFVCDLAGIVGLKDKFQICKKTPVAPTEADLFAHLNYLRDRKEDLTPEQLRQLQQLESHFVDRAFTVLKSAINKTGKDADAQAEADALTAVRETVAEGDTEERRALFMISEGNINDGLKILIDQAFESAIKNANQWRRIGRIAYPLDTVKALEAYKKVIALDQSDPWDAIYLGRLYCRIGSLSNAEAVYMIALEQLPENDERNRSVLFNEIGSVQQKQGDLSGALASYRADLEIAERLSKSDPNNADWQRDLSVSYEKVGDCEEAKGNIIGAVNAYERSLPVAQSLADRFPDYPLFQSDIKITKRRLAQLRSKLNK